MKSSSLGSMRQVTPRVLHGQVLGNALIMRSVGAWNVYIRLRRRCISSRSARWGFVMIPSVFSICDRQRRWSGFTPQRLAHKESYSTGPQLKKNRQPACIYFDKSVRESALPAVLFGPAAPPYLCHKSPPLARFPIPMSGSVGVGIFSESWGWAAAGCG